MSEKIKTNRRRSWASAIAVVALTALVAGCTSPTAEWTPQESPKKNKVSWITFDHTVQFAPYRPDLSEEARDGINRFLTEIDFGNSDRVFVRTNAGKGDHRVAAVADHLRSMRLHPEIVNVPRAKQPVAVVVGRYLVTPPRCPDWTKQPGLDTANTTSSNFGCATVTNLGLMVADPADLIHGAEMGPGDGTAAARAVKNYRTGEMKDLPAATVKSGGGSAK